MADSDRARAALSEELRQVGDGAGGGAELYRALVENSNDILYAAGSTGELTYLGVQMARYGLDPDQILRDGVMSVIVAEDRPRVLADLERSMTTGEEFPTEFRIQIPSGRLVWLEDHGRLIRDADGNVTGMWGVLRDVTERKAAESALRASEERFRRLVEHSFDVIFEVDAELNLVFMSPAIERVTGRAPAEYIGKPANHFLPFELKGHANGALSDLLGGAPLLGSQLELERVDGSVATVEVNATPVIAAGVVVGVHGIVRDVSARVALEEQVRHMQKMEAIGTLAGGVAHDFNNLLTGILGYASVLKSLSSDEQILTAAGVIESAAERAADLTRQLLGFARRGKMQSRPVDLHQLIDEVSALLARTTDRRIILRKELAAVSPVVVGDPAQLQQVVLNLLVNAADAMPEGGTITVATAVGGGADQRCVRLSVTDTGVGMSEAVRQRVFEPFFTTKARGRGTGMGLATTYGIVDNHHGEVTVESVPGQGAAFTVSLPQAEHLAAIAIRDSGPLRGRGSGRILLVDDEEIVHQVVAAMLEPLGYRITAVGDGEAAAAYFAAHKAQVDVVLLDMTMPVMDGGECFRHLRAIDGAVKVLLSTGHGLDTAAQALVAEGMSGFLPKPYSRDDLVAAIEAALAQ